MTPAPGKQTLSGSVGRGGDNRAADVQLVQQLINGKLPGGLTPLETDGNCGDATIAAIEAVQSRGMHVATPDGRVDPDGATMAYLMAATAPAPAPVANPGAIAWGAKVSAAFKAKAMAISSKLALEADYLMSAMAFESGESFSPSIRNSQSGATGLIQFMPAIAEQMGTTVALLAGMTAEEQLDYVEKYFMPHQGKLQSIEDVYMAILWPAAIGKPDTFVLFSAPGIAYQQNKGLDADHDGNVTKQEAAAMVRAKLLKGQGPGYKG